MLLTYLLFPGLSCGVVRVILHLAVLVEHRLVTDTDTQTHGHRIYRASIASRGKNWGGYVHRRRAWGEAPPRSSAIRQAVNSIINQSFMIYYSTHHLTFRWHALGDGGLV